MIKRCLLTFTLIMTAIGSTVAADQASRTNNMAKTMKYWHIYSDDKGESHAKEEQMPFAPLFPDGPLGFGVASTEGAMLINAPAGTNEAFHTAPRRLYLIGIQGSSEVTLSDGSKLKMNPGTVMLMDDTTGKGHAVQVLGKVDHIVMAVPITEPAK